MIHHNQEGRKRGAGFLNCYEASFVDFLGVLFCPWSCYDRLIECKDDDIVFCRPPGECDVIELPYLSNYQAKDKNIKKPCGMCFDAANEWRL